VEKRSGRSGCALAWIAPAFRPGSAGSRGGSHPWQTSRDPGAVLLWAARASLSPTYLSCPSLAAHHPSSVKKCCAVSDQAALSMVQAGSSANHQACLNCAQTAANLAGRLGVTGTRTRPGRRS